MQFLPQSMSNHENLRAKLRAAENRDFSLQVRANLRLKCAQFTQTFLGEDIDRYFAQSIYPS